MSNRPKNLPPAATSKARPTPLRVRVPKETHKNLVNAADVAGRTLMGEMEHRLVASFAAPSVPADDLSGYGWVNPGRDKALGDALGVLAGRIEEAGPIGTEHDRASVLAMLKIAIVDLLDQLGADDAHLSAHEKADASALARQIMNEARRIEPNPAVYGQRPELRIIAALSKEWAIKTGFE